MADQDVYITSYAFIAHGAIYKDSICVFKGEKNTGTDEFLLASYKHFQVDYPKFYKMDNLCKLGFMAVEVLLGGRVLTEIYAPAHVGIVCSNANASLDADLHYFESVKNIPSPAQFVYTLPNIVIGEISIRHHLKGENAFFVSQKFDASFMWFYVNDLFKRTALKACICGWVECLEDKYHTVLWLVEKEPGTKELLFNIDHIHQIYELSNGEING